MKREAAYRVLIFDDDESIRQVLWYFFDSRGYEVFTFPHPATCPLYKVSACQCTLDESCTDVIISDLNMPFKRGLDFLEEQLSKGCRCRHLALMSGDFEEQDLERASALGITLFPKPFTINQIEAWLHAVEGRIDPARRLASWFLGRP
jgi:DNA-binding response OmpR family regulator